MEQVLKKYILEDLNKKIILLTGPRQAGKTTLSKMLTGNFKIFEKYLPKTRNIQIAKELKREKTYPDGAEVRMAHTWLAHLSL